jgi:hypothetical protein
MTNSVDVRNRMLMDFKVAREIGNSCPFLFHYYGAFRTEVIFEFIFQVSNSYFNL